MRPHRPQPTRLPCPWDSPGKNTGVGCHFLLQCIKVKSESEVTQSWPTLSNPMDCSLPGSSIHGIFQARVPEWVAIAFFKWVAETSKNMLILPGRTKLDASIRSANVFPPFPLFSPFSLYVKKCTHCMCVIQYRHVSCCMTLPWALPGTSLEKKNNSGMHTGCRKFLLIILCHLFFYLAIYSLQEPLHLCSPTLWVEVGAETSIYREGNWVTKIYHGWPYGYFLSS